MRNKTIPAFLLAGTMALSACSPAPQSCPDNQLQPAPTLSVLSEPTEIPEQMHHMVHHVIPRSAASEKMAKIVTDRLSFVDDFYTYHAQETQFVAVEDAPTANVTASEAAGVIWNQLRSYGWSEPVVAGILGNIMAETGGQSFDIYYDLHLNGYYGMCMWYDDYNPAVVGRDLYGQCSYILETMENQFAAFGGIYGYTYEDFLALYSPEEAALVFAEVYERCTAASYAARQTNASKAYERFTKS